MNLDRADQIEHIGSLYNVPCPCCNRFLELVCYSSGHHRILPNQHVPASTPAQSSANTTATALAPALVPEPFATATSAVSSSHVFPKSKAPVVETASASIPASASGFYKNRSNNTSQSTMKTSIANYEKIRVPREDKRPGDQITDGKKNNRPFRLGCKDSRNEKKNQFSTNTPQIKSHDSLGWGSLDVDWVSTPNSRIDSRKKDGKNCRIYDKKSLPSAETVWENTLCDEYKFDGGCELLSNNDSAWNSMRVSAIRNFERSRSCDAIYDLPPDFKATCVPKRNDNLSRCSSCFSDAYLSGMSENSDESWYPSFKKQNTNCEWVRGFLIQIHTNSQNSFIGIELMTLRNGRVSIPLRMSDINNLKKCNVYKYRIVPQEGFEVKPDIERPSFLNELITLPQNQVTIVVPGLVAYSNYSLEEMKARKEKLYIWSDSVGFLSFSAETVDYWIAKNDCSLFEPLEMVSLTLFSKWESKYSADDRAADPEWDVINVAPLWKAKTKNSLESCYSEEVFRFDDFRVVGRNDKKYSNMLQSKSNPNITVSANPAQCLVDIDRVKSGDFLTAIVAPRFGTHDVCWQAMIVGQIERIVSSTNDRISFFSPKNKEPEKKVDKEIIDYVKQI